MGVQGVRVAESRMMVCICFCRLVVYSAVRLASKISTSEVMHFADQGACWSNVPDAVQRADLLANWQIESASRN